ncbi:hypothetical protein DFJ77DRAFT_545844 [Powellomyces hirtus]|nr:hypothetical protein DFJ77DRAFT_545844 [Powellomyces hirtus]
MGDEVKFTYRKQMFIVVFIHLVLWALCWIFAYAIRIKKVVPTTDLPMTTANGANTAHSGNVTTATHNSLASRFIGAENAERVARMTFILAGLATFMVTELPYNNSRATAALMWVFMIVTVFHVAAVLFTRHPYFPLGFGVLTFMIPIVVFALAFRTNYVVPYYAFNPAT